MPIVGARHAEQIRDSLAAATLRLEDAELGRLDAAGPIEGGFPHDFPGRAMAYGDTPDATDGARAWTEGLVP